MQCIAAGGLGGGNDRLDVEIGARAPAGNFVRRVGRADMQRQRVVGGIDRDGGKAGLARGPRDTNGDLAAVGDQ